MKKTGCGCCLISTCILAGFFLFIVIFLLSTISAFFGHGVDGQNWTETRLYQDTEKLTRQYMIDLTDRIDEEANRIREENTHIVTIEVSTYDYREKQWIITEKEVEECTVEVSTSINDMDMLLFLAYVSTEKSFDSAAADVYSPLYSDIAGFYDNINQIMSVSQEAAAGEKTQVHIYNQILDLEQIQEVMFPGRTDKQELFQISYDTLRELIGETYAENGSIEVIYPNSMGIPLYLQYQAPWGNIGYGEDNIAASGCGPTCIAMVMSYLQGEDILPSDIVSWAGNRYYVYGQGTSWSIFNAAAQQYGVICRTLGVSSQDIADELTAGHPVILSMGPGRFTSTGHFIVLTGIQADGNVTVNDPNDNGTKHFYDQVFPLRDVLTEAKAAWSFYNS